MTSKELIKSIRKGRGVYKIYAILNNNTKDIMYIGITKRTLGSRLSGHKWSNYLGTKDISIVLVKHTDNKNEEANYIKLFRALGYNLLNKNGGISKIKNKKNYDYKRNLA